MLYRLEDTRALETYIARLVERGCFRDANTFVTVTASRLEACDIVSGDRACTKSTPESASSIELRAISVAHSELRQKRAS